MALFMNRTQAPCCTSGIVTIPRGYMMRRKKHLIKFSFLSLLAVSVLVFFSDDAALEKKEFKKDDIDLNTERIEENMNVFSNILEVSKSKTTLMYGRKRSTKGFLTIGIPSVRRPEGHSYLVETLRSILKNTEPNKNDDVTVVVYLADNDDEWKLVTSKKLYSLFGHFCDTGFIQIIHASNSIYPSTNSFGALPTNEETRRIKWRTKQNIDFSFLMTYCKSISDYYLQLEDDVDSASHFVRDIRVSVNKTRNWICLEYSKLGFIGKLFSSKYLGRIAFFLATHFDTKPCDILLGYIIRILGQRHALHMKSLFQHTGKWSSLTGKFLPLVDTSFKDIGIKPLAILDVPKGDNPKAILRTNMESKPGYGPDHVYNGSSSYFLTQMALKEKHFYIMYLNPKNFSRVVISTGDTLRHDGILKDGVLHACRDHMCRETSLIAKFMEGEIDTKITGIAIQRNIYGFVITIKKSQGMLIIRKVSVFLGVQTISSLRGIPIPKYLAPRYK